jgi:hypothetical protein
VLADFATSVDAAALSASFFATSRSFFVASAALSSDALPSSPAQARVAFGDARNINIIMAAVTAVFMFAIKILLFFWLQLPEDWSVGRNSSRCLPWKGVGSKFLLAFMPYGGSSPFSESR